MIVVGFSQTCRTLTLGGAMTQMERRLHAPPMFVRSQDHAARVLMTMLDGIFVPPPRRPVWRKARDRHAEPSWLARGLASITELFEMGVRADLLRRIPLVLSQEIDRVTGLTAPRPCLSMAEREAEAERVENIAQLRAHVDDTAEAHEAAADALEASIAIQSELARSHRIRATELRRGVR